MAQCTLIVKYIRLTDIDRLTRIVLDVKNRQSG